MPRAVLFDLYNTLVPGGTEAERRAVTRAMGTDVGVDPEVYADLFHRMYPQRFVGAFGDLEATVLALAVQAGASPKPAAVRLAATRRQALVRRLLWPSPETLAALDSLRAKGWRLGLVTNCTAETPELWKRTPLATRFDAVAFSCELGVAKPDPGIYLAVCSFLDTAPTDCLFVGDGADNELSGAAALGMTVMQTEEFIPAQGSWPKQRIAALAELTNLGDPLSSGPGPAASPVHRREVP
jgi:putative hydrolase of the HAD superfamily